MDRRTFVQGLAAGAALSLACPAHAEGTDLKPLFAEIEKRHDEALARLRSWIEQPSIAAENRGLEEGCAMMMKLLREAGFEQVTKVPSEGQPGVFATLDAGAACTMGIYFMTT